jgi:hypothetical protein
VRACVRALVRAGACMQVLVRASKRDTEHKSAC